MSIINSYVISSQRKAFSNSECFDDYKKASILSNESFSVTLAYKSAGEACIPISISVMCEGINVNVYKIGYVPVVHTEKTSLGENGPGMYPDILLERNPVPEIIERDDFRLPFYEKGERNLLNATSDSFQSLLICINEDSINIPEGEYELKIEIKSLLDGSMLRTHNFTIEVIGKNLSSEKPLYTNWFHYDCLADIHNTKLYSDEYFSILEKYLKNASKNGMNMLLIPAFTPPLDTFIGGERQNVQLVDVKKDTNGYVFDLSLLEKFILLAQNCGIEYFEHSHLFSQWGAKHAPNIYATENGKTVRLFGWDTDASGNGYTFFIKSYFGALDKLIDKLGIADKIFFHISDEPTKENEVTYKKAVDVISPFIEKYKSGDALEDFCFYEKKFVKTPIVSIAKADIFFEKCDSMFLYYTGGLYSGLDKCTNRLVTTEAYCVRILGLHMFKYKVKGFLHWGYNYYYDRMSRGLFDPKSDPCGYKQLPGASYLVYPGIDEPLPSLREKYMCEAMNDFRALKALEEFKGYDEVMNICNDFFGKEIDMFTLPNSAEQMISFRELINTEIKKCVQEL